MSLLPGVLLRAVLLVVAVLLPSALPAGLARPDLVLLVVAAGALLHRPSTGLLVGLAGGWLLDLVPPEPGPWRKERVEGQRDGPDVGLETLVLYKLKADSTKSIPSIAGVKSREQSQD